MSVRDAIQWAVVLKELGVAPAQVRAWAQAFADVVQPSAFSKGEAEIGDFLANVLHESAMLTRMEEGLSYSAERILEIGMASAPGTRWRSVADRADKLARDPVKFANALYGGRFGNTEAGDGFKYRGSGPIMVTFKANFAALEKVTGLPLVDSPDLLRRPGPEALRVCVAWWEGRVPDSVLGDVKAVRKAVNGGSIGLADVARLTAAAETVLA